MSGNRVKSRTSAANYTWNSRCWNVSHKSHFEAEYEKRGTMTLTNQLHPPANQYVLEMKGHFLSSLCCMQLTALLEKQSVCFALGVRRGEIIQSLSKSLLKGPEVKNQHHTLQWKPVFSGYTTKRLSQSVLVVICGLNCFRMEAAHSRKEEKKRRVAMKDDDWCFLAAGCITEAQQDVIFKTPLYRRSGIKGGSPPSPSAAPSLCAKTAPGPFFCILLLRLTVRVHVLSFAKMTGSCRMCFCVVLASIIQRVSWINHENFGVEAQSV